MTDEQLEKRFQQLEDRTYELECDRNRLECVIGELMWECERLEDKIIDTWTENLN